MYDSSPLGKFEVSGPQALEFLEYVYACRLADLKDGRGRYAVMLREVADAAGLEAERASGGACSGEGRPR